MLLKLQKEWKKIKYIVYDLPEEEDVFGSRIKKLEKVVEENGSDIVIFAKQIVITSIPQMDKIYKTVLENIRSNF